MKALDKLKRQLAEAEAALEARKKPPEDTGPKIIGEGLVIDEWVSWSFLITTSLLSWVFLAFIYALSFAYLLFSRKNEEKGTWLGSKLKG